MGLTVTLILLGLILIFAEILLIPGVGIAGVLGLISIGGSCFYAFNEFGTMIGWIVTGINVLLIVLLAAYTLRAKTWKRLSLETNIDSKAVSSDYKVSLGDKGITMTRLAPMGMVRFGDESVEVKALEGMLDSGLEVEVVMIENGRIYVKPLTDDY
ncbi:MAG: NfeD family protein [Bacteroidales bacterium]|nr:NfeD family protein [Bacteroidales bacterium]